MAVTAQMCIERFNEYISANDLNNAAYVAAKSPSTLFRNEATLKRLQTTIKGNLFGSPLVIYFTALMRFSAGLNDVETLAYLKLMNLKKDEKKIVQWFSEGKLTQSVGVEELIQKKHPEMKIPEVEKAKVSSSYNE